MHLLCRVLRCRLRAEALLTASQDPKDEGGEEVSVSVPSPRPPPLHLRLNTPLCSLSQVRVPGAGRRHDADAAAEVHPSGDGQGADGEEPVQGAADGAAGGRSVDRNDQVRTAGCTAALHNVIIIDSLEQCF